MEDPSLRISWLVWEEEVVLVASTGEMSEIRGSSGPSEERKWRGVLRVGKERRRYETVFKKDGRERSLPSSESVRPGLAGWGEAWGK